MPDILAPADSNKGGVPGQLEPAGDLLRDLAAHKK
jgi:hypothetical protein